MNKLGLFLYLAFLFLIGLCVPSHGQVDSLEKMVVDFIAPTPRHPLQDETLRGEVVQAFNEFGAKYTIPPSLLAFWAEGESSLRIDQVGDRGEVGIGQFHGEARATCEAAGLDVLLWLDGIECMALLMDMGRRACGSIDRGVIWYASGSCRGTPLTEEKMRKRLDRWRRTVGI